MALPTLGFDDKADDVLENHVHSLAMTAADPLATALTPKFEALVNDWNTVNALRIQLLVAVVTAQAKAVHWDSKLDEIVDDVDYMIGRISDETLAASVRTVFFQGQKTANFKRSILEGQLTSMLVWPAALLKLGSPDALAIEARLSPLLTPCTEISTTLAAARQALLEFSKIGAWRAHIEKSNAERAAAYATLLEVPHKNPDKRLPAGYADLFFLHDTSRRGQKPKTAADIAAEIKGLLAKAEALGPALKEAEAREAEEAAKEAERAATEQQLADADKAEKEAKAKKKALKKELGKGKKGK